MFVYAQCKKQQHFIQALLAGSKYAGSNFSTLNMDKKSKSLWEHLRPPIIYPPSCINAHILQMIAHQRISSPTMVCPEYSFIF